MIFKSSSVHRYVYIHDIYTSSQLIYCTYKNQYNPIHVSAAQQVCTSRFACRPRPVSGCTVNGIPTLHLYPVLVAVVVVVVVVVIVVVVVVEVEVVVVVVAAAAAAVVVVEV